MKKSTISAGIAALVLTGIALPTAAMATPATAPQVPNAPQIQELFAGNDHWNVARGEVTVESRPHIGIGSLVSTGGFHGKTVVVRDAEGNQVCTTDDNDYEGAGGAWECWADSSVLTVGKHVLTATATNPDGASSAPSRPVTVTVVADSTAVEPVGPVDPGFTAGEDDTATVPAPGPVDPGFTGGNEDPSATAPQVVRATVTAKNGQQYVSITVRNLPGAEYHVQDATGTRHEVALHGEKESLINYVLPSDIMTNAVIWVTTDGIRGDTVAVPFN